MPSENPHWLAPFGSLFLAFDTSGTIRKTAGNVRNPPLPVDALPGLTWEQFVNAYADQTARPGLLHAWQAVAHGAVSRDHWPRLLPFQNGIAVRFRAIENDPAVALAAELAPAGGPAWDTLAGSPLLDAIGRAVQATRQVYSGVAGPLTDPQIRTVGDVLTHVQNARHLLEDLYTASVNPVLEAPLPHTLGAVLTFSEREFTERRVQTHQLAIRCEWSPAIVYCPPRLRHEARRALQSLLARITPQTAIHLSDSGESDRSSVHVFIAYHSRDPELQVDETITPMGLSDPRRFEAPGRINRLVNAFDTHLQLVGGSAWAEPIAGPNSTARFVLVLPRWAGPAP